jgi:uncharacterized protein
MLATRLLSSLAICKDQTGGLDEQRIRSIQLQAGRARQLAERKAAILKVIESQGKLTDKLQRQLETARTARRLEDLYLRHKPKEQTPATVAREQGLQPLAAEILEASPAAIDLDACAAHFISSKKELPTTKEVLAGVRHLVAENFSERADLRAALRDILNRTGALVSSKADSAELTKPETAASSASHKPDVTDATLA